jgi:hypothetical protein
MLHQFSSGSQKKLPQLSHEGKMRVLLMRCSEGDNSSGICVVSNHWYLLVYWLLSPSICICCWVWLSCCSCLAGWNWKHFSALDLERWRSNLESWRTPALFGWYWRGYNSARTVINLCVEIHVYPPTPRVCNGDIWRWHTPYIPLPAAFSNLSCRLKEFSELGWAAQRCFPAPLEEPERVGPWRGTLVL